MAARASEQFDALSGYGKSIGLAFQIADDILDVTGDTLETGKAVGADESRNKATYPALVGIEESKRRAAELVERALNYLECFGERRGAVSFDS